MHLLAYIRFGSSYVVLEFSLEIGKLTASVVEAEVVDRNPVARSAFCNETDVCLALDISKHKRIVILADNLSLSVVGNYPRVFLCSR